MALLQLPMLECTNCGQHLGHLYEDYYTLTEQLMQELTDNPDRVPRGTYRTTHSTPVDDITEFIRTYYTWYLAEKDKKSIPVHEPGNIVARALLRTQELKAAHLPFGSNREPDGQLSIHEARICCLRMFQTDPMMIKI